MSPVLDPFNYVLPDAIPEIIAVAQQKAAEHIRGMHDPMELAQAFRGFHHAFCTASRHNLSEDKNKPVPAEVDPETLCTEDRRVNFHTMIKTAAAVCYIGALLRQFPDQAPIVAYMKEGWEPLVKKFSNGKPQPPIFADTFYLQHLQGDLHYRIKDWLPKVIAEEGGTAESQAAKAAICFETLNSMFVTSTPALLAANDANGSEPCTRPAVASRAMSARAAASPSYK